MLSSVAFTIASAPIATFTRALTSSPRSLAWMILGVVIGSAMVGLVLAVLALLRKYREWRDSRGQSGPVPMKPSSLVDLWKRFLKNLPRSARPQVARYPATVVMGPVGSGKSQLIRTFVDWQGQTSQFLPSLTDSPLL